MSVAPFHIIRARQFLVRANAAGGVEFISWDDWMAESPSQLSISGPCARFIAGRAVLRPSVGPRLWWKRRFDAFEECEDKDRLPACVGRQDGHLPLTAAITASNVLPRERFLHYSAYGALFTEDKMSVPLREVNGREESFVSTRWTIVLRAGDSATVSVHAFNALSELCQIYWRPLYSFLRKQGYDAEDARDLTQGFFADLIETRAYVRADREKGRFRSFLLGTLKHFIADLRDRGRALKRGGGVILQNLDDKATAEAEAQIARATKYQAEEVYDREWATLLLRQALDRLTQECALAGKAELLSHLMPYLSATEESTIPYEEMARRAHRPVTTLRSDVARLRKRYRAILREVVRDTVSEAADVDDELRYLCRVLVVA
jgi:RNA polymerase sigma factor (sigma-70 family)